MVEQVPTVEMEGAPECFDDVTLAAHALGEGTLAKICQAELEERAARGNLGLRRLLVHVGLRLWVEGRADTGLIIDEIESLARSLAATGNDADLDLLAAVLSIKADCAMESGNEGLRFASECEALRLIGRIANGTDNPETMRRAARDYHELSSGFSDVAREQAELEMWCAAVVDTAQVDEPEVAAFRRAQKRIGGEDNYAQGDI